MNIAIFDLDGTLLNTIIDLGIACNYALNQAGFAAHAIDDYPRLVGNGINKLIERALPENGKTENNIQLVRSYFIPYYNEHNCVYTRPYENIPALLRTLRERNWHLAVASNKYQTAAEQIIRHFFPEQFDAIFGEREECPRKPDPQIVTEILSLITRQHPAENNAGEKPMTHNVLYIGDSDVDIATARNARVPVVACSWWFCSKEKLLACEPDYLIDKPLQLLDIV